MPEHYVLNAETAHFKVTGQDAKLTHTVVVETIKKNWWLIGIYAVVNLLAIYLGAYVVPLPWLNAAISLAVLIASTVVGYFMMCKVATITRDHR